jgi:hypothetical protein
MSKKILQIGTNGVLAEFSSTYEAAKATHVNQSNISKCLNKKLKKAGGFQWLYEDEYAQLDELSQTKTIWLWSFPRLEDDLFAHIVSNHNAIHKRSRTKQQLHHLLPKYLYFPHQLLQASSYQKEISCGYYAKITCDSRSNFQLVVNTWLSLGVIEVVRNVEESIDEAGKMVYSTRVYRLTSRYQTEFKVKQYFDESYGKMITRLIMLNESGSVSDFKPQQETLVAPAGSSAQSLKMTKEEAFRKVGMVVDVDCFKGMTRKDIKEKLLKDLMAHPKAKEQMDSLVPWLNAYIDEVVKPNPELDSRRPGPRKVMSETEYQIAYEIRMHREQQEKEMSGIKHSVFGENFDDIL